MILSETEKQELLAYCIDLIKSGETLRHISAYLDRKQIDLETQKWIFIEIDQQKKTGKVTRGESLQSGWEKYGVGSGVVMAVLGIIITLVTYYNSSVTIIPYGLVLSGIGIGMSGFSYSRIRRINR